MLNDSRGINDGLVRRLRCAEGHVRGIAAMVERGEDCENIVRQTLAVQGALREINRLLVNRHLTLCLREHWHADQAAEREQRLAEVVALYHVIGRDR
jgi:DNA-binding FrmR family transcriptional regulator